jgi:ABC-type nitrate/sulfonate/bicarbonate transport system permease component
MSLDIKTTQRLYAVFGILVFVGSIQLVGTLQLAGPAWPPLSAVVEYICQRRVAQTLFLATGKTSKVIVYAYAIGVTLAIAISSLVHLFPLFRSGTDRFVTFINAVPAVAIAPILIILVGGQLSGLILAAIYVFFVVYMASLSGLGRLNATHVDLFQVYGASKYQRFFSYDILYAAPMVLNGMKQAVPAAVVGAVLAEWFSGQGGLGLMMLSAMRNFQIPLLWSAMLFVACFALAFYGLVGVLEAYARKRIML